MEAAQIGSRSIVEILMDKDAASEGRIPERQIHSLELAASAIELWKLRNVNYVTIQRWLRMTRKNFRTLSIC